MIKITRDLFCDITETVFEAMIFDLDGTITETLKPIDNDICQELCFYFRRVPIAIVTMQCLSEVELHFIHPLHDYLAQHLILAYGHVERLYLFCCGGAVGYEYNLIERKAKKLYENSGIKFIKTSIFSILRNWASREGMQIVDRDYSISLNGESITFTKIEQIIKILEDNQIIFDIYPGIHITPKDCNKGYAVNYLIKNFLQNVNKSKILIIGDDFGDGGVDCSMRQDGAINICVGDIDLQDQTDVYYFDTPGIRNTIALLRANRYNTNS